MAHPPPHTGAHAWESSSRTAPETGSPRDTGPRFHGAETPRAAHSRKSEFNRTKKGAILIGTARGAAVNTQALIAALDAGKLRGAGLDVHPEEPRIDPRLLSRDDVVLLPHIGSGTLETRLARRSCARSVGSSSSTGSSEAENRTGADARPCSARPGNRADPLLDAHGATGPLSGTRG